MSTALPTIKRRDGFTIVELLIVIVVIAILAAITLVAYNGIQNRANDNVVLSDISNIRKKMEVAKIDLGHYPQSFTDFTNYASYKLSKSSYDVSMSNAYYLADIANDTYALGLRSKSLKGYILTNSGLQENVGVNAANTAAAIGTSWNIAGTYAIAGFNSSNGNWNSGWVFTN